jgi:hypothetical protein
LYCKELALLFSSTPVFFSTVKQETQLAVI